MDCSPDSVDVFQERHFAICNSRGTFSGYIGQLIWDGTGHVDDVLHVLQKRQRSPSRSYAVNSHIVKIELSVPLKNIIAS